MGLIQLATKFVDATGYSDLGNAGLAAALKPLIISDDIYLSANTTLSNVHLIITYTGQIHTNGFNLTIDSTCLISPYGKIVRDGGGGNLTITAPVVGNPMHQWLSGFTYGTDLTISGSDIVDDRWYGGSGNVGIGTVNQFGSGQKVIGIANASTAPTTNPTGGGVLYSEDGIIKWRRPDGTIDQMGSGGSSFSINKCILVDDFGSGILNDGQIGELGWKVTTISQTSTNFTEVNHPGAMRIQTSAVLDNFNIFYITQDTVTNPSLIYGVTQFDVDFIAKAAYISNTSMIMQFGVANSINMMLTTPGIAAWIEYNSSANANWVAKASISGVVTSYASSIAVVVDIYYRLRIIRGTSDVKFYVNDILIGTYTDATWLGDNVNGMVPRGSVQTLTTAVKGFIIDYFSLIATGLTRY